MIIVLPLTTLHIRLSRLPDAKEVCEFMKNWKDRGMILLQYPLRDEACSLTQAAQTYFQQKSNTYLVSDDDPVEIKKWSQLN